MERHRPLDVVGSSAVMKRFIPLLIFLAMVQASARPQPSADNPAATAKSLLAQQRWNEVVQLAETMPQRSAEIEYCYGMALARLQRWEEAARAFRNGARQAPGDKRFPLELAGVAFRQKQNRRAAVELRKALRLDPRDPYANDFLGTIYFLDDNLPAALKYWNRIEKPVVTNVASEPQPRIAPALLDRAFVFSPASLLKADELQVTRERLDLLGIFPTYRFELLPREDGDFDLLFRASERNGWGNTKLEGLLRLFRNLPYQTVNPEFFNLRRRGANFVSLLRWDTNKQRAMASFSAPLHGDPRWRYRFFADVRKEHWELTAASQQFILRKAEAGAELHSVPSARWSWMTGVALSQRRFSDLGPDPGLAQFLKRGFELKYTAGLDTTVLNIPERRFTVTARAVSQLARLWSTPRTSFAKTTAGLKASWMPMARGDDYATSAHLRWGKTFGDAPFDELFVLGMERDNDLWMHAHTGTNGGRKGSAPLGSEYALFNWELDKNVHQGAFFKVSVGPALDVGKMFGGPPELGSRQWLCDAGVQAKLRLFGGVGVVLVYGKDLRSGRNVFYPAGMQCGAIGCFNQ